jgi:peptidoglycan/LPS O-acetylase OafA/YrhL
VPIVPALDGFRAYAILGVVAIHILFFSGVLAATEGSTFSLLAWAAFGNVIDAFFIISAFVLFLPVVLRGGELGGVRRYALGRAARLVPPYWLSIAVVLVLVAAVDYRLVLTGSPASFPSAGDILVNLTALQMPVNLLEDGVSIGFGINGPLWMISVIVGFYVLFPFIARPYFRHPFAGLAVAAAVAIGWKEAVLHLDLFRGLEGIAQLLATQQLPGWAFSFGLGMTAAWLYVRLQRRHPGEELASKAAVVACGALVAYAICAYLFGRESADLKGSVAGINARQDPLLLLPYSASRAVLMASIALGPLWMQRPFANNPLRRIAELSYGIYLIHFVVAIYVGALLLGLPTDGSADSVVLWSAVVLPVSVAYAYLSFRLVERPARRWARQFSQPRASPARELASAEAGARP